MGILPLRAGRAVCCSASTVKYRAMDRWAQPVPTLLFGCNSSRCLTPAQASRFLIPFHVIMHADLLQLASGLS